MYFFKTKTKKQFSIPLIISLLGTSNAIDYSAINYSKNCSKVALLAAAKHI
jgi:hypothetical protein